MDTPPIVCDMTTARDTPEERLAEYRRLFGEALTGRERTAGGIRFRFRAGDGIEEWVRDLAAREKACCAFFAFEVTAPGDEVIWDAAAPDDAGPILEEFYLLPETAVGPAELLRRMEERGLRIHQG